MEVILLLARLWLAIVFVVAGLTKLADREGARQALAGFGVPNGLTTLLVWLLPITEIIVALALLPLSIAWFGSIGALVLLSAFLVGISVNLARGNAPDCHCFGQLHSEPVSWKVFVRNVVLAAMAALIVVQGKEDVGLSATEWMNDMKVGEILSLVFSVFAVAMLVPVFVLLRRGLKQQAELLETVSAVKKIIEEDYAEPAPVEREDAVPPVEGLPVGAMAPAFSFPMLDGGQMSLADLLARGKSVLLLFVSPNCSPCKSLLPHIRAWQRDYDDFLTVALLSKGTEKEVQKKIAKYEAKYVFLQGESSIADDYQAKWTPAAVLIDPSGKIASPVTSGDAAIRALVTHTVATAGNQNGAAAIGARPQIKVGNSLFKVGEAAPRFSLSDLDAKEINFGDLLTKETLLLFWNPTCGFCKGMADDLRRWESKASGKSMQMVFVSTGEAAEVKTESETFQSLFLHDPEMDIAPLFGANGTPSAVLIDADGNIASSLAVGERNILALLGVRKIELPIAKGLSNGRSEQLAGELTTETIAG
ncbi:MAG: redoxin domain-containing protein [Acidobacteria bacterium]|nr:redoxin domain-containing protein [Acidobacteriota bacterium]